MKFMIDDSNKNKSGVYKIYNSTNDKIYIGSAYNLYNRYRTHKSTLANGKHVNDHLQKSFNKHGSNCFYFDVIEFCDKNELELIEEKYISKFFGMDCYNMNQRVDCRYMNDRFFKEYTLIGPDDKTYTHKGTIKSLANYIFNIDSRVDEKTFYFQLIELVNDKREHYLGWRLPKNIKIKDFSLIKRNYLGKKYNITIISPSGEHYGPIQNLSKFCKEHNIQSAASFLNLINGKIKYYKGWYLLTSSKPLHGNSIRYDVIIESPTGERYGPIENMSKFARDHNLSQGGLRHFIIGKLKSYKGWKIIKPMEDNMNL